MKMNEVYISFSFRSIKKTTEQYKNIMSVFPTKLT